VGKENRVDLLLKKGRKEMEQLREVKVPDSNGASDERI